MCECEYLHATKGSDIRRQKEISIFRNYHNVRKLELPWKQPSHILLNDYFSKGVFETSFVSLKLGGGGSCVSEKRGMWDFPSLPFRGLASGERNIFSCFFPKNFLTPE